MDLRILMLGAFSLCLFSPAGTAQVCPISPCPDIVTEGKVLDPDYGDESDTTDGEPNGIIDYWEHALFKEVMCSTSYTLSEEASCTFVANLATLRTESFAPQIVSIENIGALILSMSSETQAGAIAWLTGAFGTPVGTYEVAEDGLGHEPFAAAEDFDGDGTSNAQEAQNLTVYGGGLQDYLVAVTDPGLDGSECGTLPGACPPILAEGPDAGSYLGCDWELGNCFRGIDDAWDLQLFETVLCSESLPYKTEAVCAYRQNLTRFRRDWPEWEPCEHIVAAAISMTAETQDDVLETVYGGFLPPGYTVVSNGSAEPFSPDGDLDSDGVTNSQEGHNVWLLGGDADRYVAVVTDPGQDGTECDGVLEGGCPPIVAEGPTASTVFGWDWSADDCFDNGIIDSWEMQAFQTVMCSESLPYRTEAVCAYRRNLTLFHSDWPGAPFESFEHFMAGAISMSTDGQEGVLEWFYGLPLPPLEYVVVSSGGSEPFSADGDLDGDGVMNGDEAENILLRDGDASEYVAVVLDPERDGTQCDGSPLESCPPVLEEGEALWAAMGEDFETADLNDNGIVDKWEVSLFLDVLCSSGGPSQQEAVCAYRHNLALFRQEDFYAVYQIFEHVLAVLLSMSTEVQEGILEGLFGYVPPDHGYIVAGESAGAKLPHEPFAADGDLDHDGHTNLVEFTNAVGSGLTIHDFVESSQSTLLDGSLPVSALPVSPLAVALSIAWIGWWGLRTGKRV